MSENSSQPLTFMQRFCSAVFGVGEANTFIRSSWNFRFEVTEILKMVVCLNKTLLNNDSRLNCTSITRIILRTFVSGRSATETKAWEINLEISTLRVIFFFSLFQGTGHLARKKCHLHGMFGDFNQWNWSSVYNPYQHSPSTPRGNYARIQTFIWCLGVPFLQGLQVFLLTLVNTESFLRTLVLISRLNHMP